MNSPRPENGEKLHEARRTSLEKPASSHPKLLHALSSVSGLMCITTMTCQSYALREEDYDMYKTLHGFSRSLGLIEQYTQETFVSATTPGGHKKYPQNVMLRTPLGEGNQAIILSLQKPRDKELKGRIDVMYGVMRPDGEIEEKSGLTLEKIRQVRQTNSRRRQLRNIVVQPSCLSVDEGGNKTKSTINTSAELASEFDEFYEEIQRVYTDAFH